MNCLINNASLLSILKVKIECVGMDQPLFVMTGSSPGIEIEFDMDAMPFGPVVQNSVATRKLVMHNTGDIGAR